MSEENNQLKNEIAMASGKHYDFTKADKLATLQGDVEALERRYQFEKMRKNDLVKRHQLSRIDLTHSRKMRGGVNVDKEQTDAVQRQVDILENRLDQALTKFNDALMYNKELREQIDIIREERRVFQRVHKKIEDDLRNTQRKMAERIERTNRDMDERDDYQRQAEQLQQAIVEQQEEFNDQLRELDMAMVDIKNMREDQTNLQLELETREYEFESRLQEANKQAAANKNGNTLTATSRAAAAADDNASAAGDAADAFGGGNIYAVDREQHNINDIAAQVKEALGSENMEELRKEYERLGESNFSLYKYINDLTTTKESLGDEIRDLKTLLAEENASEFQQRRVVRDLEEQLAKTEGKLNEVTETVEQLRTAVRVVGSTTEDVHQNIGCGTVQCNENNLLTALGNIEERATQILLAHQRHNAQTQRLPAVKAVTTAYDEDSEDNALSTQSRSPAGAEAASSDLEVPLLPTVAPQYAPQSVSAQRLVRMTDLPSAALTNADGGAAKQDSLFAGLDIDDSQVVSHEEIRKQMEMRLLQKREREERAARKKKEIKDLIGTSPGKAASPKKR
ncbi:outer dynein arm docking complex protein [Angomonas deanei]|nr:outer dynein arm docking complex protein [Angomonas deanei]|eukprot:EPY25294.1 outer dynein arm docking complex protein [Angomonas deanei]